MTTVQDIADSLALADSIATTANTIKAINVAISRAWPAITLVEYVPSAGTLSSGVFEYPLTLSVAPHRDLGIGKVTINEDAARPEVPHQVRQRWDQSLGKWTLVFTRRTVSDFAGKTFNVHYQYPHPTISALTDTVYLPLDYLVSFVTYWYALRKMSAQNTDRAVWRDIMIASREDWQESRRVNHTPALGTVPMFGAARGS